MSKHLEVECAKMGAVTVNWTLINPVVKAFFKEEEMKMKMCGNANETLFQQFSGRY